MLISNSLVQRRLDRGFTGYHFWWAHGLSHNPWLWLRRLRSSTRTARQRYFFLTRARSTYWVLHQYASFLVDSVTIVDVYYSSPLFRLHRATLRWLHACRGILLEPLLLCPLRFFHRSSYPRFFGCGGDSIQTRNYTSSFAIYTDDG